MQFDQVTLDRMSELLRKLKIKDGLGRYVVEELTLLLWKNSVKWELAIEARERKEPKEFYDFYSDYENATLEECAAAFSVLDPDLLASVVCREGREQSYWNYQYDDKANNFFIAGIERLITLN